MGPIENARSTQGRSQSRSSMTSEGGPYRRSSGVHMRTNHVTTPVMLGRPGGEVERAAAPTGRWSRVRGGGEILAGYAMAMAAVAIFLRAPTGSLWQVGACGGLLLASAGPSAARATTSTALVRLRRRLDEAHEWLTAQSDELGRYAAILSSTEDAIVTVSL